MEMLKNILNQLIDIKTLLIILASNNSRPLTKVSEQILEKIAANAKPLEKGKE